MSGEFRAPLLRHGALDLEELVGLPAQQRGRLREIVDVQANTAVRCLSHVAGVYDGLAERHRFLEAVAC